MTRPEPTAEASNESSAVIPNPFSTRFIRPDAVVFRSSPAVDVDELLSRLLSLQGRGVIVGPHGAGKSCLWTTLLNRLEEEPNWIISRLILPRPHSWSELQAAVRKSESHSTSGYPLIGVDGFEQLTLRQRTWLIRFTHRIGAGLLVTCHDARQGWFASLPVLCELQPGLDALRNSLFAIGDVWLNELNHRFRAEPERERIVAALRSRFHHFLNEEVLNQLGSQHHWDLREVLFSLYDHWER